MNGSETEKSRIVVDTNVIFMALYNESSKAGKIIEYANKDKIELFSPDSVKEELMNVLKREMELSDDEIALIVESLPITWVEKPIYEKFLKQTKVKHKADKPVEAVSLILGCGILTADKHFRNRVDVNKLLEKLGK